MITAIAEKCGKYLTFSLSEEEYGLEILVVQEIIGMMKISRIPRTPGFIRGVINLRGKVIPVMDLRSKFGMTIQDDTEKTCIIVVQIGHDLDILTIGILVDEVLEVLDIDDDQIEPPPSFGSKVNTDFLLGMGKIKEKVISLLYIDKVISEDGIEAIKSI
jgi:purine-binding chemotaxis protein CheW